MAKNIKNVHWQFFESNELVFEFKEKLKYLELPPKGRVINNIGKDYIVECVREYFNDHDKTNLIDVVCVPYKTESKTPFKDVVTESVKCVRVWEQNKNSLTLGKIYEVVRVEEHPRYTNFIIYDDKGKLKKYGKDNSQFKFV